MIDYSKIDNLYALIGYPLSHSFSPKYFTNKFRKEDIRNSQYIAMPIQTIDELPKKLQQYTNLKGLNVTIPYKQQVIKYLDDIDESAASIGAVNTVKIIDGRLIGYNTDTIGFEISLKELIDNNYSIKALILGSGGASKAVSYVLKNMDIPYKLVSRSKTKGDLTYQDLNTNMFSQYQLIINTTPLGMSPKINIAPQLPYEIINESYYLYDLIYNPEETLFIKNGKKRGASTMNGLKMLYLQAEAAWDIWTR